MNIHVLDIETFWSSRDYTLSKMGAIEYSRDPRAHCQMLGVSTNGGPVSVTTENVAAKLAEFDQDNDVFVGHNIAGFDAVFLHENFGFTPKHVWDTIFMMRWCGLSSICGESHAALTEKLGHGVKRQGTAISDGKHWPDDFTEVERADFIKYCSEDVAQCRDNVKDMLPYMTNDCLTFMSLTSRMATEPWFMGNVSMLVEYRRQLDEDADEARKKIMSLFHFDSLPDFFGSLRSADKFAAMLRTLGVEPPVKVSEKKTATAIEKAKAAGDMVAAAALNDNPIMTYAFSKTDLDFLALLEHEDPGVRLLVETKLEFNSSIMRSRTETFLKFAMQGKPIPIMLSAFKAHTSRYSAGTSEGKTDALQWQNLSKRNPAYKPLRRAIQTPPGHVVVAVDSSNIECRVNAWVAGQHDLLDLFRRDGDAYAELAVNFTSGYTAQQIHDGAKAGDPELKLLRNTAKTIVLGCGYGTSAARAAHAMWTAGVKLHKDYKKHVEVAAQYHRIYRQSNYAIVQFWKTCQYVIDALARGESGQFGGPNNATFKFGMMDVMGRWPVPSIMMPSGYALRYPNLRAQEGRSGKIEYVYDRKLGKNIVSERLYGSRLDENIVQGFSFQILMWQACRMYEAGIRLAGNNHDCWFSVVPEAEADRTEATMMHWMTRLPSWAPGLPIAAEAARGTTFEVC